MGDDLLQDIGPPPTDRLPNGVICANLRELT
jgi:hypothetical protein